MRIVGVGLEAVEEMLGVEDHLVRRAACRKATESAIIARFSFAADPQDLAHVEVPGLADDGDHRGLRVEQRRRFEILAAVHAGLRRSPNAAILACLQLERP